MRKGDLVKKIADETGLHYVDALVIVEAFFAEVKSSLIQGEPVYIRRFGSFILKKRAAKTGRDIKNNRSVAISEHFIPLFKAAKEFAGDVRNIVVDEEK